MAAAAVLTREKDFEDLLGSGKSFVAPDRQFIQLADDLAFPRTNYALQELKEYALRAQQKRRFWEDLSTAADVAGVPLSSYAYAQGAHREVPETSDFLSPNHDEEALAEGLHREAQQNQRNEAHAARIQSTGVPWEGGHELPTTKEEILKKHNLEIPTARPGPVEGAMGAVGEAGGAVVGARTRTGVGHDLGKAAGGAASRTAGKAVDYAGEKAASAARTSRGVLGMLVDATLDALNLGFEYNPPKGIPTKLKQPPRRRRSREPWPEF